MSLNYIMIGTNDMERSRRYYDAVMPHIGGTLEIEYGADACCFAISGGGRVWVAAPHNQQPAMPGNGMMPGFLCASEAAVDAAHAAAMANGGSNEGSPGPRPMYGPAFYGSYARDPDGNKMSFIFLRQPAS